MVSSMSNDHGLLLEQPDRIDNHQIILRPRSAAMRNRALQM